MGLVCGTPTRFMPAAAAAAWTAQATTITPALGAGVKKWKNGFGGHLVFQNEAKSYDMPLLT